MAYKITDDCASCGSCANVCPSDCIAMGDDHYEIDANECVSCGSCADACPLSAIVSED